MPPGDEPRPMDAQPPGHQGHTDAEDVFFVLRGRVKLVAEPNREAWETEASDRDLISWPVGVYRPTRGPR